MRINFNGVSMAALAGGGLQACWKGKDFDGQDGSHCGEELVWVLGGGKGGSLKEGDGVGDAGGGMVVSAVSVCVEVACVV